jgi:hypothetical protein
MVFKLNTEHSLSFITDVSENGEIVTWDYEAVPDYVLVIETCFHGSISLQQIVNELNAENVSPDTEGIIILGKELILKFINNIQGQCACRVEKTPCTCFVIGCRREGGALTIYEEGDPSRVLCDVFAKIIYRIEETEYVKRTRCLFKKQIETACFTKVSIDKNNKYVDGALCYRFENSPYFFPVSEEDAQRPFYIRWQNGKAPVFFSDVEGYCVVRG